MREPRHEADTKLSWRYGRLTRDGDPQGLRLSLRHNSARRYQDRRRRTLFVGPGEKLVLIAPQGSALFVWRRFYNRDVQEGVNAALFRNESRHRSSDRIREAMRSAWQRWPVQRLYTYVNARKVRSSNPGYCFQRAGWRRCGTTRGGLVALEATP